MTMPENVKNQILKSKLMEVLKLLSNPEPRVREASSVIKAALDVLNCHDLGPVLMIEPESAIIELVQEALHDDGIEIYGARDLSAANQLVKQMNNRNTPFRVAVLALGTDSSESLSVYHQLRAFCPTVKVILASGNLAETSILTAEEHGFWATLHKPYKMSALKTLIFSAFSV